MLFPTICGLTEFSTVQQVDLNRAGADPRLPRAIFRDLNDLPEGEKRLAYYLPQDDSIAGKYTGKRFEGGTSGEEVSAIATADYLSTFY